MKGKTALLAGVAAIALMATAQAGYAAKKGSDGTSVTPATVAAVPAGPTNAELAARVQALEDALQADEDKSQSDHTRLSTLEQNFQYASWTFDNGRPTITSGDKRFSMIFRVRFQNDLAMFMQESPTKVGNNATYKDLGSGSVVRRAHLGVQGFAFKDFWYEFRYNMGGSDAEAAGLSLARVSYIGIPNTRINVGIIEPAFMLEGTISSAQLPWMERPEIDNIAADSFGGGDARRGIEVVWQKAGVFKPDDNLVMMAAYTGQATGSTQGHANGGDEYGTHALSRVSYRFWNDGASNAMIGSSFAYAFDQRGGMRFRDRPQIRVNGDRLIDANVANARNGYMYAFDASFNVDNFWLGGEWANFNANVPGAAYDPSFSGWFVEGSWILTGETKAYTVAAQNNEVGGWAGPKVANPFSLDGDSWGAWELVARYSDTDLNDTGYLGGREKIANVGINWYMNNMVRLGTYVQYVDVDKKSGATQFGQNFYVMGMRLQFTN
jgi:phosphate-selective porin OprO and OprP